MLPKKDVIKEITPNKDRSTGKSVKNRLHNSNSEYASKKISRDAPTTTKSAKIPYRVNSVGMKSINKSSLHETEKKSESTKAVGSKKKVPFQFGMSAAISPFNSRHIKNDSINGNHKRENNKSVNYNINNKLTSSQHLETKSTSIVGKSKGRNESNNQSSNILTTKSHNQTLNYIKKTAKDYQKSYINMLPFDIALDIECLIGLSIDYLIDSLEEILKSRKITYARISRYRYKCSKNGICFNCEIFRIEGNDSSVLDTPINTFRRTSNTITIGDSCSEFNPNLDLDARIMQGNLNNNILEVTNNSTELLINKQKSEEESKRKSNLKLNTMGLGISSDRETAQIYYLQFKRYSGDSTGYKKLIKGVLDLFDKY